MTERKGWVLWILWPLGAVASVLWSILLSGAMLAAAARLGVWSYPVFILVGFVEVLLVLWLYRPKPAGWIARMMERRSKRFLAWGRVGAVLLGGLLCGPLISTALVKYLGLRGRRALLLAFAAAALTRGVAASLYLGAAEVLKEFLIKVG